MARKNSTTRKVLMKSSAMKSKGCLVVEEQLHKKTSQYSKFKLSLPNMYAPDGDASQPGQAADSTIISIWSSSLDTRLASSPSLSGKENSNLLYGEVFFTKPFFH
jgi:hypothetical protein